MITSSMNTSRELMATDFALLISLKRLYFVLIKKLGSGHPYRNRVTDPLML